MAKINPVKLKQDADRLEKAGKLDQAIAVFRQVIDDNPRDWNTINKVGDLYAKLNKNHEACEEYAKVADFYAKDGFLLKAIALWKKINRLEPAALGTYLNLADLYAKQGLMMEAKGQYQIVVEEYIKRGKMRDAGDILKKMAEIDPADLKVRSKLADLYTREGNQTKAIEEHVAIADELTKKGHLAEAAQVLEKGLKIDTKSARLRLELARVHAVQKNYEKAATVLEEAVRQVPNNPELLTKLGEAYLGCKKVEDAAAIFRRLLQSSPDDQECKIQMGRVYLMQGQFDMAFGELAPLCDKLIEKRDGERGAALLQQIVQSNPGHIRTLVKLAEVYRILQKDAMIAATYAQLTEAYIQQGHFEQAAAVLEMLVSLEPTNQQHRTKLDFVRSRKAGGRVVAPPPPAAPSESHELDEEFDLQEVEEFPGLDEAAPAAPVRAPVVMPRPPVAQATPVPARIELSGPHSEEDREFISEHLAEGKVFRKYGLVDKAGEQFEAVVARFPDHLEARLELRDVYKEKNHTAGVLEQCRALAQIARLKGDTAGAQAHEAEAASLVAPAAPAPAWDVPLEPALETEDEIPVQVDEEEAQEEDEIRLSFGEDAAVEEEEAEDELPAHFVDEQPEPEPVLDELAGAAPFDEPEPEPEFQPQALSAADVFDGDEAGELDLPFEAGAAPESPAFEAPLGRQPAPIRPKAAAEPALPPELARVLEEVDEYISLGFVDDARDALREVRDRYAQYPALQAKVRELGLEEGVAAEPVSALGDEFPGLDVAEAEAPESSFGGDGFPGLEASAPEMEFPGLDVGEPAAAAPPAEPEGEPEEELEGLFPTAAGTVPFRVEDEFRDLEEPTEPSAPTPALSEPEFADIEVPEPEPDAALGLSFGEQLGLEESQPPSGPEPAEEVLPEFSAPTPSRSRPSGLSDLDSAFADLAPEQPDAQQEPEAASEGMDLGAELFGAISAVEEPQPEAVQDSLGEAGLADIFREFKKGVDKQLGKEDYDTRYNLGIAYKEMGLLDEAIAEFQLAAKDPSRLLECSSMLGICFLEKGMPKLAIKWFEKGLAMPGRNEDEYFGLRYDLATAYEADGDVSAAMGILLDLHSQDPDFRDVSGKLRELRALSSRP